MNVQRFSFAIAPVLALILTTSVVAAPDFAREVKPFLVKHCIACHGPDKQKAGLRLDDLASDFTNAENAETWVAAMDRVSAGDMPPASVKVRPSSSEKAILTGWVQEQAGAAERARQKVEGRVVLRRLNRIEYENTLRDLLGVRVDVKDLLPADALSHGFDNVADALNISSVQMQRYLEAAELALDAAIANAPPPQSETRQFSYADGRVGREVGRFFHKLPDNTIVFFLSGTFPSTQLDNFRAWARGLYTIRIHGYAYQTDEAVPFALFVGNFGRGGDTRLHGYYELPPGKGGTVEVTAWLDPGDSLQVLPFGLSGFRAYGNSPEKPADYKGRGLAVRSVEVAGPSADLFPTRGHRLLFANLPLRPKPSASPTGKGKKAKPSPLEPVSADPLADAQKLLPNFLMYAFRRPVSRDDVAPYLQLVADQMKDGATFAEAMRAAATAALCSPDFLFLREKPGRLNDFALASRLSYFLWRTMPDEELLRLAAAGKLSYPATLRAQTERLLKHPNAAQFAADFTDAWLDLRNIDFTTPDKLLYPEHDGMLQNAMLQEPRAFFQEVLNSNLPTTSFLDSDFVMVNERLAKHYGIPGVKGYSIRKVPLPENHVRGGVLTMAGVLKVSANGTNTSPVVRGVYVLERIMGITPPPPPPGVPAVEPDIRGAKTIRELLDKHRSTEACAGCHRLIDPPGFALEEFDVVGGLRDQFRVLGSGKGFKAARSGVRYGNGPKVDASGQFTDGRSFRNFREFQQLLLADPDQFDRCLTEKLLTFSTGQDVGVADRATVQSIVAASATRGRGLRDLIHAIVQSETFRTK